MSPRRTPAMVAVLVIAMVTACSGGSPVATGTQSDGVEHIHGLGVDPADGVLYAATHTGLFRVPGKGAAARVADRRQDTMGFTITGPNTFLGSGHPDHAKDPDLDPQLGLIRSTDAAESWRTVSLAGQADFHVLHAAHGDVYGWDSGTGRLMVSADDGRTWEVRSVLDLRDFAPSPDRPGTLLATTATGLVRSVDGGRRWQPVPDTPPLVVLTWGGAGSLFGLAPDGTVHRSADGGRTWVVRGTTGGRPEAMTVGRRAGAATLYAAVAGRGIVASTDDGATFTTRYAE